MPDAYRTPAKRFEPLADYPFEPHYLEWEGLRMHYIDEGAGQPVLMLHGEPTWSYLYRAFVEPLVAAGLRAIAPDYIGFGKSDKVLDAHWYTVEQHIKCIDRLILELDLDDILLVCHDWGGPIGLRQAADMPERFSRLAILNSWLHTRDYEYTDALVRWREQALRKEFRDMPVGSVVLSDLERSPRGVSGLDTDLIKRAYDAPFPTIRSKAGVRRFPWLLPFAEPEAGNAADQTRVYLSIRTFPGPVHLFFGDADDIFTDAWGREWADQIAGATYEPLPGGAHFVTEQYGREIADKIVAHVRADAR